MKYGLEQLEPAQFEQLCAALLIAEGYQKMLDRKKELKEVGIPKDAEHFMVAQSSGKDDSPAAASRKKAPPVKTARKNGAVHSTMSKGERHHASH